MLEILRAFLFFKISTYTVSHPLMLMFCACSRFRSADLYISMSSLRPVHCPAPKVAGSALCYMGPPGAAQTVLALSPLTGEMTGFRSILHPAATPAVTVEPSNMPVIT